jgi:hypothetical protein
VTTAAVGVLALGFPMATQALLGLMIVARVWSRSSRFVSAAGSSLV